MHKKKTFMNSFKEVLDTSNKQLRRYERALYNSPKSKSVLDQELNNTYYFRLQS